MQRAWEPRWCEEGGLRVREAGIWRETAGAFKVEINVAEEKKTCRVRKGDGNWWYGKRFR